MIETIYVPVYQHTHIFVLVLLFSTAYFYITHKIHCSITNPSLNSFLYKCILKIKLRDYSYLLPYVALTFYSKICISYERESENNAISFSYVLNWTPVKSMWIDWKQILRKLILWCRVTLCSASHACARRDGGLEGRWRGRRNIWRQQIGQQQNEKQHQSWESIPGTIRQENHLFFFLGRVINSSHCCYTARYRGHCHGFLLTESHAGELCHFHGFTKQLLGTKIIKDLSR